MALTDSVLHSAVKAFGHGSDMKKLIISVCAISALTGCAVYDAINTLGYDPTEYYLMTEIRVAARDYAAQCDDQARSRVNAQDIQHKTQMFVAYSQHLPGNSDGFSAAKTLDEMAQGLKDRYAQSDKVSALFCKLKFGGIEHSADTIQHVLGNRPR